MRQSYTPSARTSPSVFGRLSGLPHYLVHLHWKQRIYHSCPRQPPHAKCCHPPATHSQPPGKFHVLRPDPLNSNRPEKIARAEIQRFPHLQQQRTTEILISKCIKSG